MIKAGAAGGGRLATSTLPRIQPDVVMVPARREEGGLRAPPLRNRKAKYAAVEGKRSFEIGDLQVNVPDAGSRINCAADVVLHLSYYPTPTWSEVSGSSAPPWQSVDCGGR